MLDLLRVAIESGAFTWAIVLAVVLVVSRIVRVSLPVAPALIRAWCMRAVIRQALRGRTKLERERALRVLKLLEPDRLDEQERASPPGDSNEMEG